MSKTAGVVSYETVTNLFSQLMSGVTGIIIFKTENIKFSVQCDHVR